MTTKTLPKQDAKTAPPKRWRNRWRSEWPCERTCTRCGDKTYRFTGEEFVSHCPDDYPSKDIAESAAAEWLHEEALRGFRNGTTYLGAFPVEEGA